MSDALEDRIVAALQAVSFHVTEEGALHHAIMQVLVGAQVDFVHEAKLGPRERIDFLAGDVGMEVKMGGTASNVFAQLQRYAASPRVRILLLLTTRLRYSYLDGLTFSGKRVRVVRLRGGFL